MPPVSGAGPFSVSRDFQYNVEAFVTNIQNFTFYVGEGPLYWYRIDWYPSICSNQTPASFTPTISYIEVNCPYEIIDNCIVLPPDCPCTPPCSPGSCFNQDIEVWHMMATSVNHLCERINQECCHRKPRGFMRRVRQYLRPALCCDVPYPTPDTIDHYVDVNFILCDCGNLVDPCIQRFVYPQDINRCGIHGPVYVGPDPIPASNITLSDDIFAMPISRLANEVDTTAVEAKPIAPKGIINKFGPSIPEILYCTHSLDSLSMFKDFLKRNNYKLDINFIYNSDYKSWFANKYLKSGGEEWRFTLEWSPLQETGFKFNLFVDKKINKSLKSKLFLNIKIDNFVNVKNQFDLDFKFNTKTSILTSGKHSVLQSKVLLDDIGIFKDGFDLAIRLKG
jgi:hypothetical protein